MKKEILKPQPIVLRVVELNGCEAGNVVVAVWEINFSVTEYAYYLYGS